MVPFNVDHRAAKSCYVITPYGWVMIILALFILGMAIYAFWSGMIIQQ